MVRGPREGYAGNPPARVAPTRGGAEHESRTARVRLTLPLAAASRRRLRSAHSIAHIGASAVTINRRVVWIAALAALPPALAAAQSPFDSLHFRSIGPA